MIDWDEREGDVARSLAFYMWGVATFPNRLPPSLCMIDCPNSINSIVDWHPGLTVHCTAKQH